MKVTGNSYDLNGNILGIKRNGLLYPNWIQGSIDILKYYYEEAVSKVILPQSTQSNRRVAQSYYFAN